MLCDACAKLFADQTVDDGVHDWRKDDAQDAEEFLHVDGDGGDPVTQDD